jgi:hypothetical protein
MSGMAPTDDRKAARSGWDAFLSYSSRDGAVVARVQRFLERYRLPNGRRLRVYRDETDITGGELPAQLRKALAESGCLVVCCSEAATKSGWVAREIEAFREFAPERPIVPVLVAGEPPANVPPPLRAAELRWSDLRDGWRFGLPRRKTRVELVRVVAAAAGMEFRELLPLDRNRRRRTTVLITVVTVLALAIPPWIPVHDWEDVTPAGQPVFGCDTLDDGIAFYRLNEPQATKNIVNVDRDVFGPAPQRDMRKPDLLPRGRLLPGGVASPLRERCASATSEWVGEPQPGTCVTLKESNELGAFADPMGGGQGSLTDVVVGDQVFTLDRFWTQIDLRAWQAYGRTLHPSNGLPISAEGSDLWLGFPADNFTRGSLWHAVDGGSSWEAEPGMSDVRSVRHLSFGVMVAARRNGELGFFLRENGGFEAFDAPGKGDELEVCGEVDGQPILRTDRHVYRRVLRSWWRAQFR